MSAKSNDFKVGLFVLVGIGLLLAALFIFGASRFFEGKTVGETYVAGDVGGLKTGAAVTLRGVQVGEVTRINFTWNVYHRSEPRYVYIEFEVPNSVSLVPQGKGFAKLLQEQVKQGLRARVKSQGLAGASIVSLEYVKPAEYPPLPVPWKPRHVYIPSAPSQFTEILASVDKIMSNLKQLDFRQLGVAVQGDLAAGQRLLNHLDEVDVTGISTNVNALVTELRGLSGRLRTFIGPVPEAGRREDLQQVSASAEQVLTQLRTTIGRLDALAAKLDVGALNETLENVRRASAELEATARELRQYPSGALFGKPPPPATSVEQPRK